MSHAEICPTCCGSGKLPNGMSVTEPVCHGWIIVEGVTYPLDYPEQAECLDNPRGWYIS